MSRCDLDLLSIDLKRSWYIKCHVIKVNLSEIKQSLTEMNYG